MSGVVAGLVCFYVLSYGPAMSVASRGWMLKRALIPMYALLPPGFQEELLTVWSHIDPRCQEFEYSGPP